MMNTAHSCGHRCSNLCRGINLSGGQKARVSLARAVYADTDTVILDDILSAVDAHVGATLVKDCILKELTGKTRIMVLHQMKYLTHADYIAVVDKGKVSHFGTLDQLRASGVDFSEYFSAPAIESEAEPEAAAAEADAGGSAPAEKKAADAGGEKGGGTKADGSGKLTTAEDREVGVVRGKVYSAYAKALGWPACMFIIIAFVFTHVSRMLSGWWLAKWAQEMGVDNPMHSVWYYLWIYTAVCSFQVIAPAMRHLVSVFASVRAARLMHRQAADAVFRCPMAWFDSTLTGKIINRFSSDMQKIDLQLRGAIIYLGVVSTMLLGSLTIVLVTAPILCVMVPPLGSVCLDPNDPPAVHSSISVLTASWVVCRYMYMKIANYYRASARELVRIESISKSPIYSAFTEALNGLSTIRSFRMTEVRALACLRNCPDSSALIYPSCLQRFCEDNASRMQRNLRVSFLLMTLNYWLTIRLAIIGNMLVCGIYPTEWRFQNPVVLTPPGPQSQSQVCGTALYAAFQVRHSPMIASLFALLARPHNRDSRPIVVIF